MKNSNVTIGRDRYRLPQAYDVSFVQLRHTVQTVHSSMEGKGCFIFDRRIPSDTYFDNYFLSTDNLHLERNFDGLPSDTLGVTAKQQHGNRFLYVVLLAPIRDKVVRLFAIAHEVGHIHLHGRLLTSDTVTPRMWNDWYDGDNYLRRMMELEANVWALFCLIPTRLITLVQRVQKPRDGQVHADALCQATSRLYGSHVDRGLASERLLLHELLSDQEVAAARRFEKGYMNLPTASWLFGGVNSVKRRQERQLATVSKVLSYEQVEEIADLAKQLRIMPTKFRNRTLRCSHG